MATITVEKECGCFKKSAYENNMRFNSIDDAMMQANIMQNHMNTKFCGKHSFDLVQNGDDIVIKVDINKS